MDRLPAAAGQLFLNNSANLELDLHLMRVMYSMNEEDFHMSSCSSVSLAYLNYRLLAPLRSCHQLIAD